VLGGGKNYHKQLVIKNANQEFLLGIGNVGMKKVTERFQEGGLIEKSKKGNPEKKNYLFAGLESQGEKSLLSKRGFI